MVKKSEWLLCMSTANSSKIMVRLPLNLNVHMKEVLGLSSFPSCVSWMSHALQEPLFLCVSKNCFVHSSLMRKQMCWIHWGVRDWQKGRGRDLSIHAWCESIAFPWKQQSFLLLQINTLPPYVFSTVDYTLVGWMQLLWCGFFSEGFDLTGAGSSAEILLGEMSVLEWWLIGVSPSMADFEVCVLFWALQRDCGVFYENDLFLCGLWLSSCSCSVADREWGQAKDFPHGCLFLYE